jgi:hypothetical protein
MAQFAVLIYSDDSGRVAGSDTEENDENDRHADELASSGAMTLAYAFTSRSEAISVDANGARRGPFLGLPLIVAGIYIVEADDLVAATDIARTNPAVHSATGGVEVRPIHSGGPVSGELP